MAQLFRALIVLPEEYLSIDNQVHMNYSSHCCYKILQSKHLKVL